RALSGEVSGAVVGMGARRAATDSQALSAPCRMSAMRASWTIARTIATIGSQPSPTSASLRMTTAAVTSTTTPRRKGRSSSTVTRSVYEVGDRLVVDDGGEHVLSLGG